MGRATWGKGKAGGDHLGRRGMKAGAGLEDRAEEGRRIWGAGGVGRSKESESVRDSGEGGARC